MDTFPNMSLIPRYVTFSLMSMPRPKHVDQHSFYDHLQLLCCRLLCFDHQSDIFVILFLLSPPGKLFFFSSSGSQLCVYFWDQTLFAYFGHFFICFLSLLVTSLWYLLFWSLLYNIFSFSSSGSQLCLLAVFETRPILVTSIYYFGHCFIISLLEELFFSISGS